ncbi:MAG: hypothetical protein WBP31_16460 [Chitinophagales bacterium]|jgi:hypothetical protein|nr:hypothetical protein [Bacteroidota bacterium]MBK9554495.1 hypothetical protein [Bacteroidota bacterium]MBL0282146.1 hypothetical protein [Bacteroidota bacterium]MBP9880280.1 hypothetical protein [Chitinophagales bacterium]
MLHTLQKNESLKGDLLAPIKSSLSRIYCGTDGWKLYNKYNWGNKCYDMILQKAAKNGYERVIVSVNFDNGITRRHYDQIQKLSKRLNSGATGPVKKILVVDNPATMEKVPTDIELLTVQELLEVKFRATEPKLVA